MRIVLRIVLSVVGLLLVAVGALYVWPLDSDDFRPAAKQLDFAAASREIAVISAEEKANPAIRAECRTRALLHPERTAKAVLLLHGFTDCPQQYDELAQLYYERGYNVLVPLAPRHGRADRLALSDLTARELTAYAGRSMDSAAGLGDETGVVGLSGGGVLGTWLATTRADQVKHLLVLSPFYRPASGQAPAFAVKPIVVLFGFHVVPDFVDDDGFSFAALSQYLRLAMATDTGAKLPGLASIAVVTTPNDMSVDLRKAVEVPRDIAEANQRQLGVLTIPAEFGVPHNAITPELLGTHKDDLYAQYIALYEG